MKRISRLILAGACTLLATLSTVTAQTGDARESPTRAAPQQEAERIDLLITECRQLMSKGIFKGISEKGQEAAALSRKLGDKVRQSRSLMYVALGMFHTGRTEEAIEPFKQSAVLAAEAGDKKLQATALNSAAVMLQQSGDYAEALHFYHQSLALSREQKDLPGEATQLRNVGGLYLETHDYSKAYDALRGSLEISRRLKVPRLEYAALVKLGKLENERGNFEAALQYAEQNLKLESQVTELALTLETREIASKAHFKLGNLEKAAEATAQMLEIARRQKVPLAEGRALANLAAVQLKLGKTSDSLVSASDAIALLRRSSVNPSIEAGALYTHAKAQKLLGKSDEALSDLRRAIALLERARLSFLPTEAARAKFVAGNSEVFIGAIDLLLSQGKHEEALAVSESYHARAFLDLLAESRADLRRVLPKELLDKEDGILSLISSIQRELWQEGLSKDREQILRKDLAAAEDTLEQFHLAVRRSNPQYASLKQVEPYGAERIRRELLDSGTALVEYVVGPEKSFAWLVLRDKLCFAALPGKNELSKLVADYVKSLAARPAGPASKKLIAVIKLQGRHLYHILLRPFEHDLSSVRKLIVVPDHALAYLPFETLGAGLDSARAGTPADTYLVERFAIAYAPSASAVAAVKAMETKPSSKGFIAFGDPVYADTEPEAPSESRLAYYAERGLELRKLPYTRREVTAIGAFFPAAERKMFLGTQANEDSVKSEKLDQFRYVHFAAHGVVDEENPWRSGIILSLDGSDKEDGILQMTEIMRLKLNADLVTLSACRTGLGKLVNGEGVLGLTRAFLYAGTRSVIASLWNVNDTATAELMTAFYRNLKRGLPKDEALRQAKLELLNGKQPAWRDPYFWASFVLMGERD